MRWLRRRLRPDNPYLLLDEGGSTGLSADADLTTEVLLNSFIQTSGFATLPTHMLW